MDPLYAFRAAMHDAGIDPPAEIQTDGKLHRYATEHDRKSKNSWYVYYDDADLPAGAFGCWKRGISETWCGKVTKTLTPEEKRAYAKRMEEAKRQREAEAAKIAEGCRTWCAEKFQAAPPAPDDHPYLVRKQISAHELRLFRTRDDAGALMVPVKSGDGTIHGIQFISPDGSKKFKTGTQKQGNCFRIGAMTDPMVICEGYATAASIHAATGYCVLVAFDAGNLQAVAEFVRSKKADLKIIVAADNDAWCKITAEDGSVEYKRVPCNVAGKRRVNIGVVRATEAVQSVGGVLVVPCFQDTTTHPTDFNDLALLEGPEVVRRHFDHALNPPPEVEAPPIEDIPESDEPLDDDLLAHPLQDDGSPFACLGYDQGVYYYLPHRAQQIFALQPGQHCQSHLLSLAPLQWWQSHFPGKNGADWAMAHNTLVRYSEGVGIFDESRVRGRGAWAEGKHSVLHLGDGLMIDGKPAPLKSPTGRYIYQASTPLRHNTEATPLGNDESDKLAILCNMLSWEKPIHGLLLAGWCVVAPICGALDWRPHLWLSGGSGAGKSWTVENIVRTMLGPIAFQVLGNTSEAGIRQELASDSRPVVFDEAEGEDKQAQARIQGILELARQASSEGQGSIYKGSTSGKAVGYKIRSCFMFSSIGVTAVQQADLNRISVLTLVPNNDPGRFEEIKAFRFANFTEEYCQSFRARMIILIPTIRANAAMFSDAVAERLGSRRTGDQMGALLAGAYACYRTAKLSKEAAREWVDKQNWDEHRPSEDSRDENRCLSKILQSILKVQGARQTYDLSIGELLVIAKSNMTVHPGVTYDEADQVLRRHGVRVMASGESFAVSNSHKELERLLEKTPWTKSWGTMLARLPGSVKLGSTRFGAGSTTRAVELPLTCVE